MKSGARGEGTQNVCLAERNRERSGIVFFGPEWTGITSLMRRGKEAKGVGREDGRNVFFWGGGGRKPGGGKGRKERGIGVRKEGRNLGAVRDADDHLHREWR